MIVTCCCGGAMRAEALEEVSPLLYHLRLACIRCANWTRISGRLEEVAPMVTGTVWSNDARYEVDRLPPYLAPMVRQETEYYAVKEGRCLSTLALVREARTRGKGAWT